ncbi:hypothetical protein JTE90_011527 [Oedothorax gibbosus]|uniref:Uncharacterized protein n=1 Tax=Oedothorax gibbosus TaxID=931172 RepID=A0AAV6UJT3_9ARAC|nr:hypothetical protein JTE90_011527 [Oedothorax gibbosus]
MPKVQIQSKLKPVTRSQILDWRAQLNMAQNFCETCRRLFLSEDHFLTSRKEATESVGDCLEQKLVKDSSDKDTINSNENQLEYEEVLTDSQEVSSIISEPALQIVPSTEMIGDQSPIKILKEFKCAAEVRSTDPQEVYCPFSPLINQKPPPTGNELMSLRKVSPMVSAIRLAKNQKGLKNDRRRNIAGALREAVESRGYFPLILFLVTWISYVVCICC